MKRYYLNDYDGTDVIMNNDDNKWYSYDYAEKKWVFDELLDGNMFPCSYVWEDYSLITEKQAMRIIAGAGIPDNGKKEREE